MDWIEFFEENYDCAGICSRSSFFFSRDIGLGRPKTSCLSTINEEIKFIFSSLSIPTLAAAFLLFTAFVMQFCLWKKFK